MNIALGAIILLLLVSPGYLFLSALHSGNYSRLNFSTSITNQIFISLIPNMIIHSLGLLIINHIIKQPADLQMLYNIMVGSKDLEADDFGQIAAGFLPFTIYIIATNIAGAILGKGTKEGILYFGLDLRFKALRIHNEWYYLLYGKILDFPEVPGSSSDIDYIQIDALVQVGDKKVIYKGFLDRFYLDNDQGLDRIILYFVYRRFMETDKENNNGTNNPKEDERYYEMPGDFLVIPYGKIINLNISYKQYKLGDTTKEMDDLDWETITQTILSQEHKTK